MRTHLPLAITLALVSCAAYAQNVDQTVVPPNAIKGTLPTKVGHRDLIFVTASAPGTRQTCRVKAITAQTLTCAGQHGQASTLHQADEILALIWPESEHLGRAVLTVLAVGGAIITGGIFLAPVTLAGAIVLYILGGGVALTSGAMGIGATGVPTDHVLYRAPGNTFPNP